ncbi:uncharacterized protein V1516DRAFT_622275 [Lipomyces oligophaga]|uniref:uncharacterized protein n=1 Tax=Lipomyces oligophaga TaxID=45792 RepID=UPI0034CF7546
MSPLPDHVLIRPLNKADIEKVVRLESHTLPPSERAGHDRIAYWLRVAPELCTGLFVRQPIRTGWRSRLGSASSTSSAASSESSSSSSSGTCINNAAKTSCSCDFIKPVRSPTPTLTSNTDSKPTEPSSKVGHLEDGNMIVIHSFSIDPTYKGKKLGTTILRDYIRKMSTHRVAERMALLARSDMRDFYENLGFFDAGQRAGPDKSDDWHSLWVHLGPDDES